MNVSWNFPSVLCVCVCLCVWSNHVPVTYNCVTVERNSQAVWPACTQPGAALWDVNSCWINWTLPENAQLVPYADLSSDILPLCLWSTMTAICLSLSRWEPSILSSWQELNTEPQEMNPHTQRDLLVMVTARELWQPAPLLPFSLPSPLLNRYAPAFSLKRLSLNWQLDPGCLEPL